MATTLDGGDASRRPGCLSRRGRQPAPHAPPSRATSRSSSASTSARQGTPLATPTAATVDSEAELPQGEPVDPAVEEAVNATVTELFACFEAGQYARAFALMTDDIARQIGPDLSNPDEDTPEEVRALLEAQLAGTPVVDEPGMEQGASMDVGRGRDIRALEGGRVGGVWTFAGDAVFIVLEQQDDRWLIDEVIDIVEDDAAMSGTPAS